MKLKIWYEKTKSIHQLRKNATYYSRVKVFKHTTSSINIPSIDFLKRYIYKDTTLFYHEAEYIIIVEGFDKNEK